jgi:hypothetical protein
MLVERRRMLRVECWLPIPADLRRPPCWLFPRPVSDAAVGTAWAAWGSSAAAAAGGVLSAVEDGSLIVLLSSLRFVSEDK